METKTILDILYYGISGILGVISIAIAVIQKSKQKNISKLKALYESIPDFVILAENIFGAKNGANKKEFVMTKLVNYALSNNIKYDYNEVSNQVESVVNATNNVNVSRETETFHTEETKTETTDIVTVEPINENNENVVEITEREMITNGTNN